MGCGASKHTTEVVSLVVEGRGCETPQKDVEAPENIRQPVEAESKESESKELSGAVDASDAVQVTATNSGPVSTEEIVEAPEEAKVEKQEVEPSLDEKKKESQKELENQERFVASVIIKKKCDDEELTGAEIKFMLTAGVDDVSPRQLKQFLMACQLEGMNTDEMAHMSEEMLIGMLNNTKDTPKVDEDTKAEVAHVDSDEKAATTKCQDVEEQ